MMDHREDGYATDTSCASYASNTSTFSLDHEVPMSPPIKQIIPKTVSADDIWGTPLNKQQHDMAMFIYQQKQNRRQ